MLLEFCFIYEALGIAERLAGSGGRINGVVVICRRRIVVVVVVVVAVWWWYGCQRGLLLCRVRCCSICLAELSA